MQFADVDNCVTQGGPKVFVDKIISNILSYHRCVIRFKKFKNILDHRRLNKQYVYEISTELHTSNVF